MKSKWKLPFFLNFKPRLETDQIVISKNFVITSNFFDNLVSLTLEKKTKQFKIIKYMWGMKFKEFSDTRIFIQHSNPKKGQNKKASKKPKFKTIFTYIYDGMNYTNEKKGPIIRKFKSNLIGNSKKTFNLNNKTNIR